MAEGLQDFLDRVHRGVLRLSPREHVVARRIWERPFARAARRAALCAALARNEDEVAAIGRCFDECFPLPVPVPVREAAGGEPAGQGRAQGSGRRGRRWAWLGVGICAIVLGVWYLIPRPQPPPQQQQQQQQQDMARPEQPDGGDSKPKPQPQFTWRLQPLPVQPARDVPPPSPSPWPPLLLSLPLVLLGLRLLLVPRAVRKGRPEEAAARDKEQYQWRERIARIHRARQERGEPVKSIYYGLPLHERFSRAVVEDSAVLLGRVFRAERGQDLDVPATLDRTIDEGGRPAPVFLPSRRARELLVLIDRENGDHPDHLGFLRLLDAWQRLGVHLLRYTFQTHPTDLDDARGRAVSLVELSRRHPDAALLIFSRRRRINWQEHSWAPQVLSWPLRAWLDPDPLRPGKEKRRVIKRLQRLGLPRFPYTDKGVVALARHLASGRTGVRPPPFQPLPEVPEEVLRLWAAAGALVPDPSWDQLEDLRRHLPEVRAACADFRQVHQLIDWVTQESKEDAEGTGHGLAMPQELEQALACWVREERPGFADRVHDRVLEHLTDQPPCTKEEDPYVYYRWELKRAMHFAPRHRDWAALEAVLDGPLAADGRRLIRLEMERAGLPAADHARLLVRLGDRAELLWRDLVRGHRRAWAWACGLAVLPGLVFLLGRGFVGGGERPAPAVVPATYRVEKTEIRQCPGCRPEMVRIPAGRFSMGSDEPEAYNDEKPVHEVEISKPFLLAESEVTQAQYKAVTGQTPSLFKGDHRPVEQVSWLDAIDYCNKLSEREGLGPCYRNQGEDVAWIDGCTGYRLPTEAEWGYAARAGQGTKYAGGDDPDKVAWYGKNANNETHPVKTKAKNAWGLYDMSGNVHEWVWDWYDEYSAKEQKDPRGPDSGSRRVFRGGSFRLSPLYLRVANRSWYSPGNRDADLGFRVARSLP